MAWTFVKRAGSNRCTVSDDGRARGVVGFLATTTTSGDATTAPASIVDALETAGYRVGATYAETDFGGTDFWCVDAYSIQPVQKAKNAEVWHVDIQLVGVGSLQQLDGQTTFAAGSRRDVEMQFTGVTRAAATYRDWATLTPPANGDVDWSETTTSLEITTGTMVDVNGRPIVQHLVGARVAVSMLRKFRFATEMDGLITYLGTRNKADAMGFERGTVLLAGVDAVQIAHGFQRITLQFHYDEQYHLEQEIATYAGGSQPIPIGGSKQTIATGLDVWHYRSVWRQPHPLTTVSGAAGGWTLADLVIDDNMEDYVESLI